MDRYKIPKEYEDSIKSIEEKTGKHLSEHLSSALLRELTENTSTENPNIYANKYLEDLKGKSYYFIKEVTRNMLVGAEMYSKLDIK